MNTKASERVETEAVGQRVTEPARAPVTLELEPEPVKPLARADERPAFNEQQLATMDVSPLDRIIRLRNLGITNDEVREFLKLQEEWETREAKKAYLRSMAAFKREDIPDIIKRINVKYPTKDQAGKVTGEVDYDHETLEEVVSAILEPMAKHGLTHRWSLKQEGKFPDTLMTIATVVTHEAGHSERETLYAMPDNSGRKNGIQAMKSTISYLERITLLAIVGLAAKGQDNDGRGAGPADEPPVPGKPATATPQARQQPAGDALRGAQQRAASPEQLTPCTAKQVKLMTDRCHEFGLAVDSVCAYFKIATLAALPFKKVDEALAWIKGGGSMGPPP